MKKKPKYKREYKGETFFLQLVFTGKEKEKKNCKKKLHRKISGEREKKKKEE